MKEDSDTQVVPQKGHVNGADAKVENAHAEERQEQSASADKPAGKACRNRKKKSQAKADAGTEAEVGNKESLAEVGKKKRSKAYKKKAIVTTEDDDNKENISPDGENVVPKKPRIKTAAPLTAVEDENSVPTTSEAVKPKKKKRSKKVKEASAEVPVVDNELVKKKENMKQGDYVIDYQGLHDALRESFCLDDRMGEIHFAPLTSNTNTFEKPSPNFSKSTLNHNEADSRSSNKSAPTAKNRHAEIPPPAFMTTERLGKKKASAKTSLDKERSAIEKIKERKAKKIVVEVPVAEPSASTGTDTAPRKTHQKKKSIGETVTHYKKKRVSITSLGTPVEAIVFRKAGTTAPTNNKKKKNMDDKKREKVENATGEEYCHPNDIVRGKNRVRFERYVDPKICEEMIKQGKYFKGRLNVNRRTRSDAYVVCETLDADIFINGKHDRNRALNGDTVVVELLDLETVWARKKEAMVQKREQRRSTAVEKPPQEEGEDDKAKPKYCGKVVRIFSTDKHQTCSGLLTLQQRFAEDSETVEPKNVRLAWFKPVDPRSPLIAIQLKNAPADILTNEEKYKNLLMVAKITRWPIDSSNPFGTIVRELGHIGNIVAETQAVLADNNIVEKEFRTKALKGLPEVPWSIKQADIEKRRDLRQTRIFTIDPATAKDLDDAVHVTKLGEDDFEIGVHIADVSHFVHQHTALDHEAFDRGTSTYLCDRVIPMLPSLLCEELCSLNPGVERLAFSVIWKMDGAGNIKDTWFGKSVIKSCAKLAYEDAQSVIENRGLPKATTVREYAVSELEQDIKYLHKISKQMRQRRFANGALSINSIRLSFKLNELGEPCGVSIYEQKDANRLIEEFMLCANMSVAHKICSHYPKEALLRQHAPPRERTLNEFIKIAENLGYELDGSSAGALQESFNSINNEDVKAVLRLLAVKPMQRAKYFCTGTLDIKQYKHYALNVPLYTHFTSPIRRFADIVVHRQLEAALLGKETCGYKKSEVQKAASHCNERKEGAKNSQDTNIQLYLYHYLHMLEQETQKPILRSAIVTQVLKDCFEILVPDYGIEKRVHMDALPIEKFVYDPLKNNLAAYWKQGVESNREYDQARKLDEDYVEPSGIQLDLDEESNDESTATKKTYKIPEELLSDNLTDHETRMQRFEPFSKITVRIQVNVERSPPLVSIYPVNPFMQSC